MQFLPFRTDGQIVTISAHAFPAVPNLSPNFHCAFRIRSVQRINKSADSAHPVPAHTKEGSRDKLLAGHCFFTKGGNCREIKTYPYFHAPSIYIP